ncbi:MAG TPA: arginine--tRNA ligase, partial [Microbacteriaceae bacterium]
MTPEQLSELIAGSLVSLAKNKGYDLQLPEKIVVERPMNREHGDWSTNVAMQLAKQAGTNPREFAQQLISELENIEGSRSLEIAGPGFLNIFLD